MSTIFLRVAALVTALLPALAVAAPLSFDQALSLATQRSEAARAARSAAAGATESARAAGQLPDPTLSVGVDNLPVTGADRFSTTADSMTMKRVGISQEWVSPDKRAAREAAGRAMADRNSAQAAVAVADVRLQTALAYADAWYASEALKLTTLNEHHAHEEFEAARGQLAAATGGSAEVLQLTSARGMAEDESAEVRQQQASAFAALQRWVGVRPDVLSTLPTFAPTSEGDFVARYPAVALLRHDSDVAHRDATVAAKERSANWTWQVAYQQRSGYSDMVSVGVSIPLQVAASQRQDRQTAAKLALVDQAQANLEEATRSATGEYLSLSSDAEHLSQRIARYVDAVLKPARQRTEAALAAYRSNQGPLSALFDARHMEVEAQRKLLSLQRDLAKVQAQLSYKPLAQGDFQ